jgi:hypothetical protein
MDTKNERQFFVSVRIISLTIKKILGVTINHFSTSEYAGQPVSIVGQLDGGGGGGERRASSSSGDGGGR